MKTITTYVSRRYQMEIFGVDDAKLDQTLLETFNASEQMVEELIRLFREWYSKQPHLPDIYFDDGYIKRLLSNRKMSLEAVKEKVDNLLTAMGCIPEIFGNRDPWSPEIQSAMNHGHYATVPKLTEEQYRLCIFKVNPNKLDNFDVAYCYALLCMFADMRVSQDAVLGDIYLWDLSALSITQIKNLSPVLMKKIIFLAEQCYGSRIKSIHLMNLPGYADFILTVVKSALKKKVGNRIFIHSGVESLKNHIPKDILPKDYGGEFPMDVKELSDNLYTAMKSPEWREWYLTSMEIKTDERKRPNNSKLMDDMLGIHGTFRKLDID